MTLLIASITLPLAFTCLLLWKCDLVINFVGTPRGIVSHVGALEALDMSHLLLLNLAHAFGFFLQGAISYMVTLFLAPEASDKSSLVEVAPWWLWGICCSAQVRHYRIGMWHYRILKPL
jgi:hypothetical protein